MAGGRGTVVTWMDARSPPPALGHLRLPQGPVQPPGAPGARETGSGAESRESGVRALSPTPRPRPGSTEQSAGHGQDSWSGRQGACCVLEERRSCWATRFFPSVRVSICQPLFLNRLPPSGERDSGHPAARAPEKPRTGYFASFTCTVTMYIIWWYFTI